MAKSSGLESMTAPLGDLIAECLYLAGEMRHVARARLTLDPEAALSAAERIEAHARQLQSLLAEALRQDQDLIDMKDPPKD